ncbi:MAG TPA: hypothetical protein VNT20_11795 [Flavisolibacter sp.]|jgi:hypothetical protein|nr:hypothetical protein [Flavisolibacter sp.]
MFKRTKGYFLLTMLVLTGLAGRMHTNILTTKERRTLVTELKSSRNDFLKSIEGLSPKQCNFRPGKKELSVKECVYKLASIENYLWTTAKASLKEEPIFIPKSISNDEALVSFVQQKNFQCNELKFKDTKEALKFYKNERAEILKYVHTSTENVRAHGARTCAGSFDAYQLMLLNAIFANYYTQQIENIKMHANFPK